MVFKDTHIHAGGEKSLCASRDQEGFLNDGLKRVDVIVVVFVGKQPKAGDFSYMRVRDFPFGSITVLPSETKLSTQIVTR